jgi:hypothetical protein
MIAMKMPSAESVHDHLMESAPCALQDLPRGKVGIYALRYPSDRIVQIGSAGLKSATEDFHSRIANRHRSGSEGEYHKASGAFNVGRMYRHLERSKKTPTSKLRWNPLYGDVMGFQQTERSAKVAKKVRNEVVSRSVTATWFPVERTCSLPEFEKLLKGLEERVQELFGVENLAWYGKAARPVDEPIQLVDEVVQQFKASGRWGTGSQTLVILGDEEELLDNQAAIWRAASARRS